MPSITENISVWGSEASWSANGDEWSGEFGTTDAEWRFMLFPRLQSLLPADSILEIAPGYGRWTQYLKDMCRKLTAVDLNQNCVDHCYRRFSGSPSITFFKNDGRTLPMVQDGSIDLVFSFDSLVHVDADVMKDYSAEISRILRPGGRAFLHHSHLGKRPDLIRLRSAIEMIPSGRIRLLCYRATPDTGWRGNMTADLAVDYAAAHGLSVQTQEILTWSSKVPTDCISVLMKPGAITAPAFTRIENLEFMKHAHMIKRISQIYGMR